MTQSVPHSEPKVLISQEELHRRVHELAAQIEDDYRDSKDLLCIGVLKGSIFFLSDLLQHVRLPWKVDLLQAASYGSSKVPGEVRIRKDVDMHVRGRDILLVEDIVDTGYTLATVLELMRFRKANSVKLCTLLEKPERREVEVPIDYCGFQIEDRFVVGYGLDYDEQYRNLPYIGYLDD